MRASGLMLQAEDVMRTMNGGARGQGHRQCSHNAPERSAEMPHQAEGLFCSDDFLMCNCKCGGCDCYRAVVQCKIG
jgi:hypothetical protein